MTFPIRCVSDLHCEFLTNSRTMKDHLDYVLPPLPTDKISVLILAGDISNFERAPSYTSVIEHVKDSFRDIIIISGNHEWYGGEYPGSQENFLDYIKDIPNIHYLDGTSVTIDDVVFIGATLWTDFEKGNPKAMDAAHTFMNDYACTETAGGDQLKPEDLLSVHYEELAKITDLLEANVGKQCVMVTHHGCSYKSIHPQYKNAGLTNYAFTSDLEYLIRQYQPRYWFHGHTHSSHRYKIGETEVIVNPAGYRNRYVNAYENYDFNPELTVYI